MIGRTLRHYRVLERVGAGGMGEVYRARDTHLDRDVAIKVLPEDFAADAERVARFEREAKLLAQLNHSNIASIYGFEQSEGVPFIAMECVEGETLAEHLKRGPLPVELALRIAIHIAGALEAAHEKGIIHRDLKPANVMLTPDVKVKVLDFGLAKAFEAEAPIADLSHSPTIDAATQAGVILGTAAYMSPEQARGQPLDRRTDVWSFGCVLYEMLTGRKPFAGTDVSDMIATILRDEPDWSLLPAATPSLARSLLRRCLSRDPERRLHDIADARIEIEEALGETGEADAMLTGTATRPAPRPRWMQAAPWAVAALAAAAAVWLGLWPLAPAADVPVTRLSLSTEPLALGTGPKGSILALSPDGSTIAYVSGEADIGQIYLRRLDSYEAVAVEGAERAQMPFFSPDGQWLGFFTDSELRKVRVVGGPTQKICKAHIVDGATWSEDDTIIYGDLLGLLRVSANGGTPETIVRGDASVGEWFLGYPQILPNGEEVLFTVFDGAHFAKRVEWMSLRSGERKEVMPGGSNLRYLSTGHLIYAGDDSLMVVPFDPDLGQITGDPELVMDGLLMGFLNAPNQAHFAVSDTGTLAYVSGPSTATRSLLRVDRAGRATPIPGQLQGIHAPRFSPDGGRIAVAGSAADGMSVWVYDLELDTLTRMILQGDTWWPVWSPDGKRLTYTSLTSQGMWEIFWTPADGSGSPERLVPSPNLQQPNDWSSDGTVLILQQFVFQPAFDSDVLAFRPGEDDEARPILNSQFSELLADLSPDGRWLAYTSNETGPYEVYVRSFPDLGKKRKISSEGGIEPVWSPDGAELFYRDEQGLRMMVVDVEVDPELRTGTPRLLFEGDYAPTWLTARYYDVAPDGQSFVLVQGDSEARAQAQVRIVLNWTEELKRLVSTGR